jgi:membrane fusion protein, multidrug efflux system
MVRKSLVIFFAALMVLGTTQCSRQSADTNASKSGGTGTGKGGKSGRGGPGGDAQTPVSAATAKQQDMPVYLRGLGSVTAYNTAIVKSRIDGPIVKINFQEGQDVKENQVLAVIDPRTFQATVDQAKATRAKDQAALKDAQTNLARYQELFKQQVLAKQQLDTQGSQVGQLEGTVGTDDAQIEAAALQLSFTKITAPISGQIGLRHVDVGNIIHAADANGLATITQLDPIAVLFTLPEDQLQQVLSSMRKGPLVADVYDRDDTTKLVSGKLLTVDNTIDPTTGTSKLKAVFANKDRKLWPNQFVNVHLLVDNLKNAVTIPSAAIIRGANGALVYVVKQDGTVEARTIKAGITQGNVVQVAGGLQAGEVVVTDGQDRLQDKAKVRVATSSDGNGNPNGQGRDQTGGHRGKAGNGDQNPGAPDANGNQASQKSNQDGQRYYGGMNAYQNGQGSATNPSGNVNPAGTSQPQGSSPSNRKRNSPRAERNQEPK